MCPPSKDIKPVANCPKCHSNNSVGFLVIDGKRHYRCYRNTCQVDFVDSPEEVKNMYIIVQDPFNGSNSPFMPRKTYNSIEQALEVAKKLAIEHGGKKFFIAQLVKSAVIAPNVTIEDV